VANRLNAYLAFRADRIDRVLRRVALERLWKPARIPSFQIHQVHAALRAT